jgi:hypothetical protein
MKNAAFSGLPVFMLVMGFFVIGCDTPTNGGGDTWTEITSLNQLNGTWKGSYSQTLTLREFVEGPMQGTWDGDSFSEYGDMRVTISTETTSVFNAGTVNQTETVTYTFSGGNTDAKWATIKSLFTSDDPWEFDDTKHSASVDFDFSGSVDMDDVAGVQINQNGTQVKIPADNDSPEMILTKQ